MAGIIEGPFRHIVAIASRDSFRKIKSPLLPGVPSSSIGAAFCTLGSFSFPFTATLNSQGSPTTTVVYEAPIEITQAPSIAVYKGSLMRAVSLPSSGSPPAYFEAFSPSGTKLSAYAFEAGPPWSFYGGLDWDNHATVTIKAYRGNQYNNDSLQPFLPNEGESSDDFWLRWRTAMVAYAKGPARTHQWVDPIFGDTVLQSLFDPDLVDTSNWYNQTVYGSADEAQRKVFSCFTLRKTKPTKWVLFDGVDLRTTYDVPQNFVAYSNPPTPPALTHSLPPGWSRAGATYTVPAGTAVTSVSDRVVFGVHHLDITYIETPGGPELSHSSLVSRDMNAYQASLNAAIERKPFGYLSAYDVLLYVGLPIDGNVVLDESDKVSRPLGADIFGVDRIFFMRIVP